MFLKKIFLTLLMIVSPQVYSALSCEDSFSSEPYMLTGKSPNITTVRLFIPEQKERAREWGERILGRNLTEIEVDLLVVFYNKKPSPAVKTQILNRRTRDFRHLSFSKREIEILSQREVKLDFIETVTVNIPRTQEEKGLKAQGFNQAYRRGIDEVNEWIAMREQLVRSQADPYLTHVDYFAKKMSEHITYIEEGLLSLSPIDTSPSQVRKLNGLKQYAKELIDKKQVTYHRWLMFSLFLSKILTVIYSEHEYEEALFNINHQIVRAFPDHIAIPTITGEMGVIAINKGGAQGIYPLGLKNTADSFDFFHHDIFHFEPDRPSGFIYTKLIEHTKRLPLEKRKNIELAYFILTHEGNGDVKISDSKSVMSNIEGEVNIVVTRDNLEMRELIDVSRNRDKKIQTLIDDFLGVYDLIQREIQNIGINIAGKIER